MATIAPALGEAGNVTVIAPEVVLTKYPSPEAAVKLAVLIALCQFTAPALEKPDAEAPDPNDTVSPLLPIVKVLQNVFQPY